MTGADDRAGQRVRCAAFGAVLAVPVPAEPAGGGAFDPIEEVVPVDERPWRKKRFQEPRRKSLREIGRENEDRWRRKWMVRLLTRLACGLIALPCGIIMVIAARGDRAVGAGLIAFGATALLLGGLSTVMDVGDDG